MERVSCSVLFWADGNLRVKCRANEDGTSVHVVIGEPCHGVTLMLTPEQLQQLADALAAQCEQRIVEIVR